MAQFGFLSNVGFKLPTAIATIVVASVIGAAASALPAVQAAKLAIADALRRQE
jgi:ABC-type antimicrobial peptide transport system permease subunit